MTATTAIAAYGTLLKREDPANPGSFVAIPNITQIALTGPKRDSQDASQMAGVGWKEKILTLNDAGQITLDIDYNPDDLIHQGLFNDQLTGTKRNYKYVLPNANATTRNFTLYVISFVPDAKVDGKLTAKVMFDATGPVT